MSAELTLLDRARIYSFISGLFSDPDVEKFHFVRSEESLISFKDSCERLGLSESAVSVIEMLSSMDLDLIKEEHVQVFGHTLSKETSPYELEFLKNKEVFALTQGLADISGFYSAFGLLVDAAERADHIAVQAEFLSFLNLKEAVAMENHLPEENAEVCRRAQADFARDHFFWWAQQLAENLIRQPSSPFYNAAGQFLKHFIDREEHNS